MGFITPAVVILLFLIIIVVTFILTWVVGNGTNFEKSKLRTFVSVLIALGIFITFAFYFSVIQLQEEQARLAVLTQTARINKQITALHTAIQENSTHIPDFVASLIPLSSDICPVKPDSAENQNLGNQSLCNQNLEIQATLRKRTLSHRIFSIWQEVELASNYVDFHPQAYVASFLQYASSAQLHNQWLQQRLNFGPATQKFGDLLFEHGQAMKAHTTENYTEIASTILIQWPRKFAVGGNFPM